MKRPYKNILKCSQPTISTKPVQTTTQFRHNQDKLYQLIPEFLNYFGHSCLILLFDPQKKKKKSKDKTEQK